MKKTVLLITFILTACTINVGDKANAPETTAATTTIVTTTTTTEIVETTVRIDPEEVYLQDVKLLTDLDIWYDDYFILEYGRTVCDYFDQGGDKEGLVQIIFDAGLASNASEDMMMAFAGAAGIAVTDLCPEHEWKIA